MMDKDNITWGSLEKLTHDLNWKGDATKVPIVMKNGRQMVTCRLTGKTDSYFKNCHKCLLRICCHYNGDEEYVVCRVLKPGQTIQEAFRENEWMIGDKGRNNCY